MKKVWWQVSLYCLLAGWLAFKLKIKLGSEWAHIRQPNGTVTMDNTRWIVIGVGIFLAVVLVGGLAFFRRLTRREVFYSASVWVALNIVMGLFSSLVPGTLSLYWALFTEWSNIAPTLLTGLPPLLAAVIAWVGVPYLFVLFGRKEEKEK